MPISPSLAAKPTDPVQRPRAVTGRFNRGFRAARLAWMALAAVWLAAAVSGFVLTGHLKWYLIWPADVLLPSPVGEVDTIWIAALTMNVVAWIDCFRQRRATQLLTPWLVVTLSLVVGIGLLYFANGWTNGEYGAITYVGLVALGFPMSLLSIAISWVLHILGAPVEFAGALTYALLIGSAYAQTFIMLPRFIAFWRPAVDRLG
jgi:hypothetical protein